MWGGNAWTYAMFKKYKTVIFFMIAGFIMMYVLL